MKIIFACRNSWKIVFVQLIFNQNDLFFTCNKSSNTIKISFVEMSFTKTKLFSFNSHAIIFHTEKPISNSFKASLMQRRMVTSKRLIGCWEKECLWMWVMWMVIQLFIVQHGTTELTSSNVWYMRELMWTDKMMNGKTTHYTAQAAYEKIAKFSIVFCWLHWQHWCFTIHKMVYQ